MHTTPAERPRRPARRPLLGFLCAAVALYALSTLMLMPGTSRGRKYNLVLLGVDERKGDKGRSDTVMVMSMDYLTRKVRLLSIPRDTRVQIAGHGYEKLNAAYAYGGAEGAVKAVSSLLDIPIHGYVVVNFNAVIEMVDSLGGVTITVDKPMKYDDPYQNLHINIRPGTQVMNGKTALEYARFRSDAEGDIARTRRQQTLVTAVMKKAASPASWSCLPALLGDFRSNTKTNISMLRIPFLGFALMQAAAAGIETRTMPGKPAMVNGGSYWMSDAAQLRETVEVFLEIPPK